MDRYNEGKPELSKVLEFGVALEELSRVSTFGRSKYPDVAAGLPNWKSGQPKPLDTFIDSATRHLLAISNNEFVDPESGCAHLAHVAWNALAALYHYSGVPGSEEIFEIQGSADDFDRMAEITKEAYAELEDLDKKGKK